MALPTSEPSAPARVTSYNGLEKLPPEIRRQILSILDLHNLSSLVHASAVFHEQYLEDRRYLLCSSLETTLGTVTPDACAAFQSGSPHFSYTREDVINLLGSFRVNRQPLHQRLREHEAVEMAAFHLSIISPLLQHYVGWALGNLAIETGNMTRSISLSRVEETRLLRSFYRFQLCCNLFGKGGQRPCTKQTLGFRPVEILQLFFCLFEPWEVEEISCINTFAQDKYDHIFREISWDVNERNPKFDGQRPPTPEGAFDFDNSWARERLLTGTVSRGLELLHKVTFKIENHSQLVQTMQEYITWPLGNFIAKEALGETAQWERRQDALSERDEKQNRRDPLPFNGDSESCPPLAWTLIWGGTYSNLYGYYIQDTIRRFGYVFFDATTIESLGAKDILLREWKKDWGDSDPRNDI
ncbi:hypothetical protein F5Y00DRAFT_271577 [Daldinia vernicosa]|uniref:uncharacterized protein n=1 Tax=Daldinia vernicosa TaxID=114800 RepID=UPI002007A986|nr:uncharacterized protein F5Y00DRAFT_271577 [Daldinia vernicosa]KAI0853035.1 hypothetical protein F5Y00DRAFT_271577 [Daldinia vernicosa]